MHWNPRALEEVELVWICASDMLAVGEIRVGVRMMAIWTYWRRDI
jgi:hypothetical protein